MDPLSPARGPGEHRYWREMIGAYVLGGLDEEERAALQEHLDGCPSCRAEVEELWPVVDALADATPERIASEEAPPVDLRDRVLAQIGRERRFRRWRQSGRWLGRSSLAAAAAALFVAIGFFLLPRLLAPEVPLEPVAFSREAPGVEAEANLIDHTWGTETRLVVSGLKEGQTYEVALENEDGEEVPSGAFIGTGDEPIECNLNAALLRENATGLEVSSANGELILYADLSGNAQNRDNAAPNDPEMARIPDVRGMFREAAEKELREAGFEVEADYRKSSPDEAGKILSQSPPGDGSQAEKGSRILITLGAGSGGPGDLPIPAGGAPSRSQYSEDPTY